MEPTLIAIQNNAMIKIIDSYCDTATKYWEKALT